MDFILLVLIAIALAMDAFAVSISSGIIIKDVKLKHALKIASSTGFFQGFFTFLGWLGGMYIAHLISNLDHWIAFTLLLVIGTVAFGFSVLGVLIGNKVGQFFGNKVELIGGVILIGIGVNILIDHLFFV